jgi:hypothetical protein
VSRDHEVIAWLQDGGGASLIQRERMVRRGLALDLTVPYIFLQWLQTASVQACGFALNAGHWRHL